MALDIYGYNATFKAFADFARQRVNAGDELAIADAKVRRPLGGRSIVAVTQSLTDEVHKWTRGSDEWNVNDRTRDLFKKAIINMFGGESKIPASVKEAMLLGDYNAGKPLTARRILAVKAAIDADGTAKARAAKIKLETFSPDVEKAALALGYSKKELPTLARAAHFYAKVTGQKEMDAMKAVAQAGSQANRLMQYGGRFMENAKNFAAGLRLMDKFAVWHQELCDSADVISNSGAREENRDYSTADTPSKLNANRAAVKPETRLAMEKFVFEQLAFDPSANLKETDAEKLFGFKNNDASRFIGQDFAHSLVNTVANIPPAKRATVFKVFNLFCSLSESPADHRRDAKERYLVLGHRTLMMGRVLRNLDKLLALDAKGQLTAKNVIKACFPDMVAAKATGNYDLKAVSDFLDSIDDALSTDADEGGYMDIGAALAVLMESTGCTLAEGVDAIRNGKSIPMPQYVSPGQLELGEFDTIEGGRKAMEADLYRPCNYSIVNGQQDILPPDTGFGFNFPGEDRFATNGSQEGRANMKKVGDKVVAMCGAVHAKQACSVMMMLSQSGLGPINRSLKGYGVFSTEHSAMDYTLSKNADTGAVTIKYSSPAGLPFHFEWTATVDVDGVVTTTPLKFEKPVEMNVGTATKFVEDAAKDLGVKLTRHQKNLASALVARYGTDMYEKNARIFAKFVVRLRLTDASAEGDRAKAADTAKSIRKWHSFGFGDHRLAPYADAAKAQVQATIRQYLAPAKAGSFKNNVFSTMWDDANRSIFVLNGKVFDHSPADELIGAFKELVKDPKSQKILSIYMNQLCFETVLPPSNHVPLDTGVDAIKLPGTGAIANRDMTGGLYMTQLISTYGHDSTYDLKLSEDGKTATITETISADLSGPHSNMNDASAFGSVTFTQRIVIDLSQDEPVVTDYKLAQTIE